MDKYNDLNNIPIELYMKMAELSHIKRILEILTADEIDVCEELDINYEEIKNHIKIFDSYRGSGKTTSLINLMGENDVMIVHSVVEKKRLEKKYPNKNFSCINENRHGYKYNKLFIDPDCYFSSSSEVFDKLLKLKHDTFTSRIGKTSLVKNNSIWNVNDKMKG